MILAALKEFDMTAVTVDDVKQMVKDAIEAQGFYDEFIKTHVEIMLGVLSLYEVIIEDLSKRIVWVFSDKPAAPVYNGSLIFDWLTDHKYNNYKFFVRQETKHATNSEKFEHYPVEKIEIKFDEDDSSTVEIKLFANVIKMTYIVKH